MADNASDSEYEMTDSDFQYLKDLILDQTGIALNDSKRKMVYRRLFMRLTERNMADFKTYCRFIASDRTELMWVINAITTNVTRFFREADHFDFLEDTFLPELVKSDRPERTAYIWSAGCSSGQEPYTLALTLKRALHQMRSGWDFKILATDIDSNMLATAKAGQYPKATMSEIPQAYLKGAIEHEDDETFTFVQQLREKITFNKLNLMDELWPIKRQMDLIICRNVMIYFTPDRRAKLISRYVSQIKPGGYLLIGHSESVPGDVTDLSYVRGTIYRKVAT